MIYFLPERNITVGQDRDRLFAFFRPVIALAWLRAYDWRDRDDPEPIQNPIRPSLRQWCEKYAKGAVLFDLTSYHTKDLSNYYQQIFFEDESDFLRLKLMWVPGDRKSHQKLWWTHKNPNFPSNQMDNDWQQF